MNLIILGPQGSGKGTQAKQIADELGLFYFETGRFLRELAKSDTRVDEIVNKKGGLIPDEEIFSYVSGYLEKKVPDGRNIILDGYPRSVKQYELLDSWLRSKGPEIDKVILLDISEKESIRRLSARRVCQKCSSKYNLITKPPPAGRCKCGEGLIQREDDKPESIKKRLVLYEKTTKPLIEIFEKKGILIKVDGERPIEVILKDILVRLKEKYGGK